MPFLRRHSSIITVASLLLVFPVAAHAQVLDFVGLWSGFNRGLQEAAYFIVINGLGLLVWFGALILDFAINTFVIGFGDTFVKSGIGLAVNQTWVIIRDFVNMFFIFGFVYIGFKMILNSSDSNTRRWLVNILLAALLVNFSLFITKFAIDFSNQLASQIAVNGLGSTGAWDPVTNLYEVNLTSEFMARMGISNIMGIQFGTVEGGGWGYVIGTAILFLTAAFVFAAGGIILIIRFAMLNLFMMLSPIMFLSWVLPPVRDTMQRFWSSFFGRAMYAPIYLLFIYFSLQIIAGLQISVSGENNSFANPNWAGAFQSLQNVSGGTATGTLGTLPFFILICIFLALSISFADKLGADGGSMAVKLGKSFSNKTRRFATRNTVGYGAMGLNKVSGKAQDWYNRNDAALSKTAGGRIARAALTVGSLGALSDKNLQGAFKAGKGVRAAGSETYDEYTARREDIQKRQNTENKVAERGGKFAANTAIYRNEDGTVSDDAKKDARGKLAAVIRDMSDDELKNLSLDDLTAAEVSTHLSDAQIKTLADSGKFSNDNIKAIRDARDTSTFTEFETALENDAATADELGKAFDALGKTVKDFSDERVSGLGARRLTDRRVAANLSESQMESIQKSGKYTAKEFQQIKDARKEGLLNLMGVGDGNVRSDDTLDTEKGETHTSFLKTSDASVLAQTQKARTQKIFERSSQDVGKLPVDLFTKEASREFITPQMVEQRMRNGDVSNEQLRDIKTNIDGHIASVGLTDPTKASRIKKSWETWVNRSTYGAHYDSI
jgi:hypothetical protein